MTCVIDAQGRIKEYWGEVALADLADYARGSIIRGGADWEAYAAETNGAALVGDGTDIISDLTPAWAGRHTFNAGVELPDGQSIGIAGNELLTVNAAGNFTFSGVTSVIVPDGAWVGADAACSWVFDSTNGYVTTLDRVGIGTATPTELVHAQGAGAAKAIKVETTTAHAAFFEALDGAGPVQVRMQASGTAGFFGTLSNHPLDIVANNTIYVRVLADGKVGINTLTPDTKFQNVGDFKTGDDNTNYVNIGTTGDVTFVGGAGLVFGSCYGNHIGWQQAAAAQNTWYNISDADMISGPLHNVTHDGNGKLTVTEPGMYLITYSLCFQDDAANDHVEAGIEVSSSGSAEAAGQCHLENKFANEEEHMSSSTTLDLADNATLEVCIRTTDAGTPTIDVQAVNLTCVQIGGT